MSNVLPLLTSLTENATEVPVSAGQVENYVLLLVLLSVFAAGMLVLLSLLLLFCHRCCMSGRRFSRASDDLEKTNATYTEDSQPTQEITIHLDESDALSAASCHDGQSERFVSTGFTGRRVSFNESALYQQERMAQDKTRRYTLTEGDFHHLKKARLTNLHIPPAPCDLKILTIMECDSTESSTINISDTSASKLPLAIYQPTERKVPDWMVQSLSGGLPGDPHHSTILDQESRPASLAMKRQYTRSQTMEAFGDSGEAESIRGELTEAPGQTSVLHFFSKLRRHASLEGAGPYFRRWKFDSSHRAASLDAKGSPKRRPFQRQRAASETTDHAEDDSPLHDEVLESLPYTPIPTSGLQSLSAESLSHPPTTSMPSVFFSSLKLEAMVELGGSSCLTKEDLYYPPNVSCSRRTEDGNGGQVEKETKVEALVGADARNELEAAENDDLFGMQQESGVQERFDAGLGQTKGTKTELITLDGRKKSDAEVEDGDELLLGAEARVKANSGSSLYFTIRQESSEAPLSLYRDIWSLRASLEQYASSDQSSTDRESVRSDADSVSSLCGAGARSGLDSCLSQDLDDEPEGEGEVPEGGIRRVSGGEFEMGSGTGGEGEAGNRKLLQMDSGYASIEAPSRAPEEMRLFGTPGAPRGKTASERRLFFTSSGRKGSVCESIEVKLFQEELEEEMSDSLGTKEKLKDISETDIQPLTLQEPYHPLKSHHPLKLPESQSQLKSQLINPIPQPSSPHQPRLRRRDYSIDEKTDALFNEFLRHDPRFDQQDSPMRSRHRSRVHLRKQWQRHKQYSDPGSTTGGWYSPSLERQRFTPLRRGDSAGYPLDTRYHSTLSRIASAADEEAIEVATSEEAAKDSTENKLQSSEGASGDSTEITTSEGTDATKSCTESIGEGDAWHVSTEEDTESTRGPPLTVSTQEINRDPRVDNRNNNSSQDILSDVSLHAESNLTDKLVASLEERLYTDLRSAEKLSHGGTEQVLVSQGASPCYSPI